MILKKDKKNDSPPEDKNTKATKTRQEQSEEFNGVSWVALTRHIIFIAVAATAATAAVLYRDLMLEYFGWSLVPLGLWTAVFAYLIITRTSWIVKHKIKTASSLLIALGGAAMLGIYDAPIAALSGPSMGGIIGEYLARAPFDWEDRYNIVLWHQIQAWTRVLLLFGIGLWGQFPSTFAIASKILMVGIMIGISFLIGVIVSLFTLVKKPFSSRPEEKTVIIPDSPTPGDESPAPTIEPDTTSRQRITPVYSGFVAISGDGGAPRIGPSFAPNVSHSTAGDAPNDQNTVFGIGQTLYAEPDPRVATARAANPIGNTQAPNPVEPQFTTGIDPNNTDYTPISTDDEQDPPFRYFNEAQNPTSSAQTATATQRVETETKIETLQDEIDPLQAMQMDSTISREINHILDLDTPVGADLNIGSAVPEQASADASDQDADPSETASHLEQALLDFPWHLPSLDLLPEPPSGGVSQEEIEVTGSLIQETLAQHGVNVSIDHARVGPTVTMYALKPGWKGVNTKSKTDKGAKGQKGKDDENPDTKNPNSKKDDKNSDTDKNGGLRVRVDTILNREKDIALALGCPNIRFESVIPGSTEHETSERGVVGIEVPNSKPIPVNLRSIMDTPQWISFADKAALPVPMGIGSDGGPVMADFAKMPHTLVAGATGSGKSVCMNTIVSGILLTKTPMEVRMVMIDPKRVELTPYQGVPHLYTPVVVDPERAVTVLKALTKEMMERFATLEAARVKNIASYNERAALKMPYLLILVDELADLMLTSSNEVEQLLVRLAQLGRATGVHLVVATQRPSVDVVTGLIKANFPSRISFSVMSQVDSRTILDSNGAEKLLGKGDMLYKPIDLGKPARVQGAFLSEEEIENIVEYWKRAGSPPLPHLEIDVEEDSLVSGASSGSNGGSSSSSSDDSSLFEAATEMAASQKTLSTSLLQRRLKIGYPRAARLMDELEEAGIVGPGELGKPRQVIQNNQ